MTSLAGEMYRLGMHRGSVMVEADPEASLLGIPREHASSLMKSSHTTKRNITAVKERVGETDAQSTSELFKDEVHHGSLTQDPDDFDRDDSDTVDESSEASCGAGGFTSGGSGSFDSTYTSFYTTSSCYESSTTVDEMQPLFSRAYDKVDDEVKEDKAMVVDEASRINSNSNSGSSRFALGNYSITPEISGNAFLPEQQRDIEVASSVSCLPSAMVAGARSSQDSLAYLLVARTLEKRTRRASSSAASLMVSQASTTTALNRKPSRTFAFSASDSFSNQSSAPSEDEPIVLGERASSKAGARPSNSLELQNSTMFSQLNLSLVPERHRVEELTPLSNGYDLHRGNGKLRPPSLGDNVHWTVRPMQETEQQCRAHPNRTSRDESFVAGGFFRLQSSDDKNIEGAMSGKQSESKSDSTFPSFTAYFARSISTMGGETRKPSSCAKLSETLRKTAAGESFIDSRGKSSDSTKVLSQCSSFFCADAGDGRFVSDHVFRTATTSSPNGFVRVLRGDFDNRDISLDSRLLDADHHHKVGLTSMKCKGPWRPPPTSSGHTMSPGGGASDHGARKETVRMNRATSGRCVDGSVCRHPSGNVNLSIVGAASSGNLRGSLSLTRPLSSGQVQSLPPVPSSVALLGGWRLLSFHEQSDTPLTNVEHVPHNGKPKKHKKDKKKGRRHKKHCTSCHAAEYGQEVSDARSGQPAIHEVLKDENCRCNAARAPQGRNTAHSQAEVADVSAAGAAPTERPDCGTHFSWSSSGRSAAVSQERCGIRSRGDASRQLLDHQCAALHNRILQPHPPRMGVLPDAGGQQMRILLSRTPVRTISVTSGTRSARRSLNSSAEKSARPAASTYVPELSGAAVVHAVRRPNDDVSRNPTALRRSRGPLQQAHPRQCGA